MKKLLIILALFVVPTIASAQQTHKMTWQHNAYNYEAILNLDNIAAGPFIDIADAMEYAVIVHKNFVGAVGAVTLDIHLSINNSQGAEVIKFDRVDKP